MIRIVDNLKTTERKRLLQWRSSIPADLAMEMDRRLNDRLIKLLDKQSIKSLAVYSPIRDEPNIRKYYPDYEEKYQLALPVCSQSGILKFFSWKTGEETVAGSYGILVPATGLEVLPDAVLVPCVGFTRSGYRLGYGGGWFDKTLPQLPKTVLSIGVAYDGLELSGYEPECFDVPLNYIVTESAVHTA
jgi:5,10-methenyltetrahydrofolate synthetase